VIRVWVVAASCPRILERILDRFVSHFTNRLDAKGRVSIPASFRSVLAKDGFEGLFVHPALEQPAFDCGGHALLREIDGLLNVYSPYSQERDVFSTALLGTSEILKVDSEGRVFLPETVKSHACIASEVTFVGLGHKFRIWEPERFRAHLDEARDRVRDMRKQIGARHAVVEPRVHGARE
jgi:MraZ protein